MRKILLLLAGALLTAAPTLAHPGHCADVRVFTGYTDALRDAPQTSGAIDPGIWGCQAAAAHANTNYIMPAATQVFVAATGTQTQPASDGAIKFDNGQFQSFTFVYSAIRSRWVSPFFRIPAGTRTITARGTATNTQTPKTQTVFYEVLV